MARHRLGPLRSLPVIARLCLLAACWDFATYFNIAPLTAVYERIICDRLADGDANYNCKAAPVQSQLASLKAWKEAISQIPCVLLAVPFGVLADRIGKKPLLMLFFLGAGLADVWIKAICLFPNIFPLRLVWTAPLLEAIGGGIQLGPTLFFAVAADLCPGERRADAFMKLSSTEMMAQILASPIAASMMEHSNWYPLACAAILIPLAFLLVFTLPETSPPGYKARGTPDAEERDPLLVYEQGITSNGGREGLMERVRRTLREGTKSAAVIWDTPVLLALLTIFLPACFGTQSWVLLLQYASVGFGWDYGKASLLFTLRGFVNLGLFTVIMPAINAYVSAKGSFATAAERDFRYSQVSCALIIVGFAIIGLSTTSVELMAGLVVSALGSSFLLTLRSAMTFLVPQTCTTTLYAAVSASQSIGVLVAGPLLALAFSWGVSMGGTWIGTPFLLASICHVCALFGSAWVRW